MHEDDREDIEKQLRDFEYLIKKARIKYEQFFMGNERREPSDLRGKIRGIIKNSSLERHRRAAVKFRFMSLVNRFVTLQTQWDRMLRQMEEGTFDYRSYRGFVPREVRADEEAPQRAAKGHDVSREVVGAGDLSNDALEALAEEAATAVEGVEKAPPADDAAIADGTPAPEAASDGKPDLQGMLDHLVAPVPAAPPTAAAHRKLSLRPPKAKRPEPSRPSVEKPSAAKAEAKEAEAPKPLIRPSARHRPAPERIDEKPAPAAPAAAAAADTPPPVPTERTPEKRLYEKYMTARQRTGGAEDGLAFADFEKRIAKKRDLLKKKFRQENFEFDVVTKEGKVRIVAKKK